MLDKRSLNSSNPWALAHGISISSFIITFFSVMNVLSVQRKDFFTRIDNLISQHKISKEERIFLSGSPVFWINSKEDIQQVRGGNDASSLNPYWAMAAYQIREGADSTLSRLWLQSLGTRFILLHNETSEDIFHDFRYTNKFLSNDFHLSTTQKGDSLFWIHANISRIVDQSILDVSGPNSGKDTYALENYVSKIKRFINYRYENAEIIDVAAKIYKNEAISLAITYDANWHLTKGKGKIISDPLGNILIVPYKNGLQEFELTYRQNYFSVIVLVILITVMLSLIFYYKTIIPYLVKRLPHVVLGLNEEDEY